MAVFVLWVSLLLSKASSSVLISGRQLYVDGQPFEIRGLCYSPVPIGENIAYAPYGDYFTEDYAYMWYRDLPAIRLAGVNTLRIYGWNVNANHTQFLDVAHRMGFKLMLTYFLGTSKTSPVKTAENRTAIINNFVSEVQKYASHPAVIFWSFGNELNALWNNFVLDLNKEFSCGWESRCYNTASSSEQVCINSSKCMYGHLFDWINEAARRAKQVSSIPVTVGFADVDFMVSVPDANFEVDKIALLDDRLPDLAAWSLQLYRGKTFGKYFRNYQSMSKKPLIITEYGVDAYNDPCGWPENFNNEGACMNLRRDGMGGTGDYDLDTQTWCRYPQSDCARPGTESQALWDVWLTREIMSNSPARGGAVLGGFLMAWQDEYWKGKSVQDACTKPCPVAEITNCTQAPRNKTFGKGGSAACKAKAHFTCSNWDTTYHDLCGYYLYSFPDAYVNEEWFGIAAPVSCGIVAQSGHKLDSFKLRSVYFELQELWSPQNCFAHAACHNEDESGLCCPDYDGVNRSCCSLPTPNITMLPTKAFKPTPAPTQVPTTSPTPAPPTVPGETQVPTTVTPTTQSPTLPTMFPTLAPSTPRPSPFPTTPAPSATPTTSEPSTAPSTAPSSAAPSAVAPSLAPQVEPSLAPSAAPSTAANPTPAITLMQTARRRLLTNGSVVFIPSCRALEPCWKCLMGVYFDDTKANCRPICENMTNDLTEPTPEPPTRRPTTTEPTVSPTQPTQSPTAKDGVNIQQSTYGLSDPDTATALVLVLLLVILAILYKCSMHLLHKDRKSVV